MDGPAARSIAAPARSASRPVLRCGNRLGISGTTRSRNAQGEKGAQPKSLLSRRTPMDTLGRLRMRGHQGARLQPHPDPKCTRECRKATDQPCKLVQRVSARSRDICPKRRPAPLSTESQGPRGRVRHAAGPSLPMPFAPTSPLSTKSRTVRRKYRVEIESARRNRFSSFPNRVEILVEKRVEFPVECK